MAGDGRVAVISASLARALWPSSAAIGQTITTTGLRPMLGGVEVGSEADAIAPFQVVGVAGDVRRSLVRSAVHEIYIPLVDIPSPTLTLQVRGREPIGPRMLSAAVTRAIRAVDPELPLDDVGMLDDIVARAGVRPRFLAALLGGFSAIAAVGALIGLYATSAWVARQRRREAAIRLALGAAPHQIVRTFTAHGAGAVAAGLAVGWWASLGLGRLLSRELTGVNADDPTTRIALAAALCVCCVLAIYRPARAVARMSPASTLRE
jgi:putative ABC transport system permease protein